MPFVQEETVFRRLFDEVIAKPEIRQKIESAELTERGLTEFIDKNAPDIWAAAAARIVDYNDAEKKCDELRNVWYGYETRKPYYLKLVEDVFPTGFKWFLGLLVPSLFSLFFPVVRHFIYDIIGRTKLSWTLLMLGVVILVISIAWAANRGKVRTYAAKRSEAWRAYTSA